MEPVISPIILNTWVSHISDPFISIDAIEVLEVTFVFLALCLFHVVNKRLLIETERTEVCGRQIRMMDMS